MTSSRHADNNTILSTFKKIKTTHYKVQKMFPHFPALIIRLCPEKLSELRSLCGFDFIEDVRNCLSVRVP